MPKRERPSTAERALQLANERNQRNLQIGNRLLVQHQRELRDTPPLLQKLKQDHPTDRELCRRYTSFTEHEFTVLVARIEALPGSGTGRNPNLNRLEDRLFLILVFLHTGSFTTCFLLSRHITKSRSTTWRAIWSTVDQLYPIMSNLFCRPPPERLPELPNVSVIIDATVVQIDKPIIRTNPVDSTFSGKHHFHCLKWTVGVTPVSGTAMMLSRPVEGATHDWVAFQQAWPQFGPLFEHSTNMGDAAYIAGEREHGAIIVENGRNEQYKHQRALVERFFGRLKSVCAILSGKWPFRRAKLPAVFALCVCVTNYHISQNPLTQGEDRIEQAVYDNALLNIIEATEAIRASDRRYRENLRRREQGE